MHRLSPCLSATACLKTLHCYTSEICRHCATALCPPRRLAVSGGADRSATLRDTRPRLQLHYDSLARWLQDFVARPGSLAAINVRKERRLSSEQLADISDGSRWKQASACLNGDGINLALGLSIDRFKPYKTSSASCSCGPMFVTILNLPPELWYRLLRPLVDNLLVLESGIDVKINGKSITLRARLVLFTGGTLAWIKIGGFCGHALKGRF
ncbi:uncharacterized protein PSFLO_03582 [Pseudozyma flocculosa]|uniref:Uncharacterized protein n=1 Tax=Pseudozyma flocculosa TaxID=84751 RepID=A0A5C3F280_9BASI|nr:uncharacterized protein PSFLO_03582 [Pseudozyma flocculosa]